MNNYACFIVSTGRCGTQWLTRTLQQQLATSARGKHEPLGYDYAPVKNSPAAPLIYNGERIHQHLNYIQQTLRQGQNYIETGFPCWRHLAWFAERLNVPVKVIHLTRHPVFTAVSWLKLNAYVPPILPHLPTKELFTPFANDATLKQYRQCWKQLSPFEKCLYYWAEVHLQALKYQRHWLADNWLRISYEELFTEHSLNKLNQFLDILPSPNQKLDNSADRINQKVDNYGGIPQCDFEPELIHHHSEIVELANCLGYQQLAIDKQALLAEGPWY